ncbi:MAG: glycosyltransferase, partial [Calditrichae bacterium]|nr:glycosyltransferase [Calditrichia bacterium]
MKLSIIIPAYNEEGSLKNTITQIIDTLTHENVFHEVLVVNDNSSDNTELIL